MIIVDLHMHTSFSRDCRVPPETVAATCQKRGLGAIAVTDHNTIAGALAVQKIASFPVIIGEEIKTSRGEIIGLFLKEEIPRGLEPRETIARIRDQGGIVGVPHPMDRLRRSVLRFGSLMEIIDEVDYLEVLNSRVIIPQDNKNAWALAQARKIPMSAGSDAHTVYEYGRAYVEMPEFKGREDFLAALRQGKIGGGLSTPLVHFASSWNKIYKRYFQQATQR